MKKIFTLLTAVIMVLGFTVSANATLWDRGGGLIYDDDFNITWLQDANYAVTSGYDADGWMDWHEAMMWADTLVYGGYDDWRLPSALNQEGSGPCLGLDCTGSEMGHLYYTELGNPSYALLLNTGPFINLERFPFWSGTEYALGHVWAWDFSFLNGDQLATNKDDDLRAWAVRPGDVAAVPEPGTLLLLGSGLAGLAVWRKRQGLKKG